MSVTEWLLNFGINLIDKVGYGGLTLALLLDSCGLPIPSEAILALGGAVARTGRFNVFIVMIIGTVAQILGSLIAYAIGKYGGEPLIKQYGKYLLISAHDYDRAMIWFERHGERAVLISRLVPVMRTFVGFGAGTFEMPLRNYLRDTAIGSAIWTAIFVGIGYFVGDRWRAYVGWLHWVDYIVLVVVVGLVIRYIYRKTSTSS